MGRQALLVGCNYPGTNAALNGCINDVWGTKDMLIKFYGFQESEMAIYIDTDPAYTKPTGKNIKDKLTQMVATCVDGDVLVFHFSGHGTQVPCEPGETAEVDGKDEAICPCDMNLITDDDLRAILQPLSKKPNVKFTFIADCCHSGTLLDHSEVIITGPKAGGPPPPNIDVQAIQSMLSALGAGPQRDFKNRALPFNDLLGMLSQMLGTTVTRGNVRSSMGQIFGADASIKIQQFMQYAQYAQKALAMLQGPGGAPGAGGAAKETGVASILSSLLGMCLGAGAATAADQNTAANPNAQYNITANGTMAPPPAAGVKPPVSEQLHPDVGILMTGCQDKETSADACPSGDKAKAHGALSNAMQTVVANHHAQNPGQPLTYRNLVIAVRDALAKTGFAQNPCLECSDKWADAPFITH